jgi:hypothetical protein
MTGEAAFQAMIRDRVQPFLKEAGYSKKGTTFRRINAETVHLVSLQKSRKTTRDEVQFAVNLAVGSMALLRRAEVDPATCAIEDCQWRVRLGASGLEVETWWSVRDETSAAHAAESVTGALRSHGLPALHALPDDASLRDTWLSGRSPGLTDVQRLVNLSALLQRLGPEDKAQDVISTMKQMAAERPLPILLGYLREIGKAP